MQVLKIIYFKYANDNIKVNVSIIINQLHTEHTICHMIGYVYSKVATLQHVHLTVDGRDGMGNLNSFSYFPDSRSM